MREIKNEKKLEGLDRPDSKDLAQTLFRANREKLKARIIDEELERVLDQGIINKLVEQVRK